MASQQPWYADQDRGGSLLRITLRLTRRSPEVNSDLEIQRQDSRNQMREDLPVPGQRTPDHGGSSRRSGERPFGGTFFGTCETCDQAVGENDTRCSGCNQRSHNDCRDQVKLGEKFRIEMCYMCINHVKHELRKARVARAFQERNEDYWFQSILNYIYGELRIWSVQDLEFWITYKSFF